MLFPLLVESMHHSIIIPAYNEAGRILPYLRRITDYMRERGRPYEVLVVDDGSTDATPRSSKPCRCPDRKSACFGSPIGEGKAPRSDAACRPQPDSFNCLPTRTGLPLLRSCPGCNRPSNREPTWPSGRGLSRPGSRHFPSERSCTARSSAACSMPPFDRGHSRHCGHAMRVQTVPSLGGPRPLRCGDDRRLWVGSGAALCRATPRVSDCGGSDQLGRSAGLEGPRLARRLPDDAGPGSCPTERPERALPHRLLRRTIDLRPPAPFRSTSQLANGSAVGLWHDIDRDFPVLVDTNPLRLTVQRAIQRRVAAH